MSDVQTTDINFARNHRAIRNLQINVRNLQERLKDTEERAARNARDYESKIALLEARLEVYKHVVDRLLKLPASVNMPSSR